MAESCSTIANKIEQLQSEKEVLSKELHSNPQDKARIAGEIRQISAEISNQRKKLNECLAQPFPSVPLKLSVSSIRCNDENDPGLFESDEPYILVYVFNMPSLSNPMLPQPKVVKIAPFGDNDVDKYEQPSAPPNILWGIDGKPALLNNPDDAIFLVALLENDSSSPEGVRTLLETEMVFVATQNATSASNRNEFANRLRNGMDGALSIALHPALGFPDPDDQIGPVQELRLTKDDLSRAFHFGSTRMELTFEGDGGKYQVFFELRKA